MIIYVSISYYKTSLHVTKRLKAYLLIQIQVVCKLHWHLEHSRNHHTLCPMYCCSKLLLDPHWNLYLHEVWCYHLYRLLDLKYSSKMNQLLHTSAAHIQHTHTHTILKKINWNSIWRLFNCPNYLTHMVCHHQIRRLKKSNWKSFTL